MCYHRRQPDVRDGTRPGRSRLSIIPQNLCPLQWISWDVLNIPVDGLDSPIILKPAPPLQETSKLVLENPCLIYSEILPAWHYLDCFCHSLRPFRNCLLMTLCTCVYNTHLPDIVLLLVILTLSQPTLSCAINPSTIPLIPRKRSRYGNCGWRGAFIAAY